MSPNDAGGMANSVDPDQTAPCLIWVCTVCPGISVRKLRIIMVFASEDKKALKRAVNSWFTCKDTNFRGHIKQGSTKGLNKHFTPSVVLMLFMLKFFKFDKMFIFFL